MDSYITNEKKWVSRELQMEINNLGIITLVTPNCLNILGYSRDELIGTNISKYLDLDFSALISSNEFKTAIIKKDGIKSYFDIYVTNIKYVKDSAISIDLSLINIDKYKELENREKITLKILEHAKDLVCRLELVPKFKFTYLSQSVEDFLGYTLVDCLNNPMLPFEIVHPDDRDIQFSKIKGDTDFSNVFQVRMKHKSGYYIWIEDYVIPEYDENNQLVAVESITRNIQDKKELELRLKKLGYTDNLTGLSNKNYFLKEMDLLNTEINIPVGIIVCDLDNLKYINDSLGHSKGDSLIKNTGQVLESVFNNEHVISRIGGDEFIVIIKNKTSLEVNQLYTELQNSIGIFNIHNKDFPIKISVGLAYSETSVSKMQSIFDSADSDMYKNKKKKINEHTSN